ncbi:hypothetical protein FJT64_018030 [Amphibalanus amphitrite]|uniref:Uncharacterized protein n=1 Tax=Amphibalanus amphitrite TaxID=1232801 RepID=A0A6A4X9K6_AMPAM|nr:hypothetical protein FJT64_018030 [Amphibalanus amphitrite]
MEDHSESTHAPSSDDNLAAGGGLSSHSNQDTSEEHPHTGSSLFGAVDTDNAQGSPGSLRTRPVTGAGRGRHGVVRAQRRRESPPPPPPPPEFGDGPVVGQPAARVPTPPTAAAATATTGWKAAPTAPSASRPASTRCSCPVSMSSASSAPKAPSKTHDGAPCAGRRCRLTTWTTHCCWTRSSSSSRWRSPTATSGSTRDATAGGSTTSGRRPTLRRPSRAARSAPSCSWPGTGTWSTSRRCSSCAARTRRDGGASNATSPRPPKRAWPGSGRRAPLRPSLRPVWKARCRRWRWRRRRPAGTTSGRRTETAARGCSGRRRGYGILQADCLDRVLPRAQIRGTWTLVMTAR